MRLLAPEPFTLTNTASQLPPIDNESKVRIEGYFGQGTLDISDQLFLKAGPALRRGLDLRAGQAAQLVSERERRVAVHEAKRRPRWEADVRQAAGGLWRSGHPAEPVSHRVHVPQRRQLPGRVGWQPHGVPERVRRAVQRHYSRHPAQAGTHPRVRARHRPGALQRCRGPELHLVPPHFQGRHPDPPGGGQHRLHQCRHQRGRDPERGHRAGAQCPADHEAGLRLGSGLPVLHQPESGGQPGGGPVRQLRRRGRVRPLGGRSGAAGRSLP